MNLVSWDRWTWNFEALKLFRARFSLWHLQDLFILNVFCSSHKSPKPKTSRWSVLEIFTIPGNFPESHWIHHDPEIWFSQPHIVPQTNETNTTQGRISSLFSQLEASPLGVKQWFGKKHLQWLVWFHGIPWHSSNYNVALSEFRIEFAARNIDERLPH